MRGAIATKIQGMVSRRSSSKPTGNGLGRGSENAFWPADFLPMHCPSSRIMVFGYETTVAKPQFSSPTNQNSIFAHSKALVNDLSRERPLERPLIFVAHSLGGIVIKEVCALPR